MDIKTLLSDTKARFAHNSAKAYLQDKFDSKLIVADQGGLWRANSETINFLNSFNTETVILIDTFQNPVQVNRKDLLTKLQTVYTEVMSDWHKEWSELENKR